MHGVDNNKTYLETMDRNNLDPELGAYRSRCGYDCYIIARPFLRQIASSIESSAYVFRKLDGDTLPSIVESIIWNILEPILLTPVSKRDKGYYRDLSSITGIPYLPLTRHDINAYVKMIRNSFLRGIELGMIRIYHMHGMFKFIHVYRIELDELHPSRIYTVRATTLEETLAYWKENGADTPLPYDFYFNDVRLRQISPYIHDSVYISHTKIREDGDDSSK